MQVILQKNVTHLGLVGDVVNVADGYYRNYLAPRGLALLANPKSIKELAHQKKIIESKKKKAMAEAIESKKAIESRAWAIAHLAGAGDKLFGSITSQEIAVTLRDGGVLIDRRNIRLEAPIKTLGTHKIEVKVHPEVSGTITLEVTAKA